MTLSKQPPLTANGKLLLNRKTALYFVFGGGQRAKVHLDILDVKKTETLASSNVCCFCLYLLRPEAAPVNLQLPKIKFNSQSKAAAVIVPPEPRIKFNTEKTTSSTGTSVSSFVKRDPGESEFKKRKIGDDKQKNLRTRTEDD